LAVVAGVAADVGDTEVVVLLDWQPAITAETTRRHAPMTAAIVFAFLAVWMARLLRDTFGSLGWSTGELVTDCHNHYYPNLR
jgi:sugar phosphate permease